MTTSLRVPVEFNNSTGSNTAASGVGPGAAVTGTAAAHTGGAASTTITLTNTPDLSGVQAGDLLWLKTASGRQYSVINTIDNVGKTVTVDDSFTIAAGSAVNYAIGGKRLTLDNADSRQLFTDWKDSTWGANVEYTGTNYTLTSVLTLAETSNRYFTLTGTGGRPIIEQTANAANFGFSGGGSYYFWVLVNLKVVNSNATKNTSTIGVLKGGSVTGGLVARNCIFGDATNTLYQGVSFGGTAFGGVHLFNCEVLKCVDRGLNLNYNGGSGGGNSSVNLEGCYIHDNGGHGVYLFGNQTGSISQNIIYNHSVTGSIGIFFDGSGGSFAGPFTHNTIHNNASDGVRIDHSAPLDNFHDNTITQNGGYGLNSTAAAYLSQTDGWPTTLFDYNNYGTGATANTSGAYHNISVIPAHDLAVDPQFTNPAGGDFSIGTNLKATGYPLGGTDVIGANSSTYSYVDIGAAQRQEAGSTGGMVPGIIMPTRYECYGEY